MSDAFDFTSLPSAVAAARASGRWVLIDFTASWCAPCQAMERTTWRDPQLGQWLRQHVHAVRIDIDQDKPTAETFKVRSVPTVLALKDGVEVDRFTGARPTAQVLAWCEGLLRGVTELDRLREAAAGDDVQGRHAVARHLLAAGRADEALAEYLWLWTQALTFQPEWRGVRSSFLLSELEDLVRLSPRARAGFERERELAGGGVSGGRTVRERSDWFALNQVLGDTDRSLQWFERNRQSLGVTELGFFESWLVPLLKAAGRWAEIALFYPDPVTTLEQQHDFALQMLAYAPRGSGLPPEMVAAVREQAFVFFRQQATDLVRALRAAGRSLDAQMVVNRAQEHDPSPAMAEAVGYSA